MKTMIAGLAFAFTIAATAAGAQPVAYPPNEAGVTMGHWHLNSQQVEANKKLFVALGGTAIKPGDFEIVRFPGVAVFLHQAPGTPPPSTRSWTRSSASPPRSSSSTGTGSTACCTARSAPRCSPTRR